ncbi:unnamed protein product [Diatraea saccharalis]|uniref:Uncharacterized protein n=1 Tax=Diatraea saccharalis TaxID=40085 RepID=A0A9N9WJP6_9NEOP|nr:unnamed protein product [Diatraea saccharalis]
MIAYRFIIYIIYCHIMLGSCIENAFISMAIATVVLASDVILMVYSLVFYSVYQRLKKFATYLKDSPNVIACCNNYKMLADQTENTKRPMDVIVSCFSFDNINYIFTSLI